jgi:hypothetical protein
MSAEMKRYGPLALMMPVFLLSGRSAWWLRNEVSPFW